MKPNAFHEDHRPERGFTLIEVLVAASLLALVILMTTHYFKKARVFSEKDLKSSLVVDMDLGAKVLKKNLLNTKSNRIVRKNSCPGLKGPCIEGKYVDENDIEVTYYIGNRCVDLADAVGKPAEFNLIKNAISSRCPVTCGGKKVPNFTLRRVTGSQVRFLRTAGALNSTNKRPAAVAVCFDEDPTFRDIKAKFVAAYVSERDPSEAVVITKPFVVPFTNKVGGMSIIK